MTNENAAIEFGKAYDMNNQITFFADENPDNRCDLCKHYSALKEPRDRSDGAVIYGYCFKSGDRNYSPDMGKGYPVFINGGFCKEFTKRRKP